MDLATAILHSTIFAEAQRSASQAAAGADVSDYDEAVIVVNVTGYTDGQHDFTVMVSDDGISWSEAETTISDFLSVSAASEVGTHYLSYQGSHPHVGVKCDATGTTTGATWGAYLVAADPETWPVRTLP